MITDLIVLASVLFTVAFLVAWGLSPGLRSWLERPKHRFHDLSQDYDLAQRHEATRQQEHAS